MKTHIQAIYIAAFVLLILWSLVLTTHHPSAVVASTAAARDGQTVTGPTLSLPEHQAMAAEVATWTKGKSGSVYAFGDNGSKAGQLFTAATVPALLADRSFQPEGILRGEFPASVKTLAGSFHVVDITPITAPFEGAAILLACKDKQLKSDAAPFHVVLYLAAPAVRVAMSRQQWIDRSSEARAVTTAVTNETVNTAPDFGGGGDVTADVNIAPEHPLVVLDATGTGESTLLHAICPGSVTVAAIAQTPALPGVADTTTVLPAQALLPTAKHLSLDAAQVGDYVTTHFTVKVESVDDGRIAGELLDAQQRPTGPITIVNTDRRTNATPGRGLVYNETFALQVRSKSPLELIDRVPHP